MDREPVGEKTGEQSVLRSHGNAGCGSVKYSLRQERKPKRCMAFEDHSLRDNAGIAINLQHLIKSERRFSIRALWRVFLDR
jgi:hypothetical protein